MAIPETTQIDPNYSKQIDIESLISAPLVAASKANVVMVTGQTRFLLDYCFSKTENDENYRPVMINMTMHRSVIDEIENEKWTKDNGEPRYFRKMRVIDMQFSVPLLCLVPLSSLAINKVNIEFDMEITAASSWESSEEELGNKKVMRKGAQLSGKISYDTSKVDPDKAQYKSAMSSKLKVHIDAGPLPLPLGVTSIIELYTKSIQAMPVDPANMPDKTQKNDQENTPAADQARLLSSNTNRQI